MTVGVICLAVARIVLTRVGAVLIDTPVVRA